MEKPALNTYRVLSLEAAETLLNKGTAEATERGLALAFAVSDSAGNLIAFRRMDGASLVTIEAAQGKARTAALLKGPSSRFAQIIDAGRTSMLTMPGLVSVPGGVTVRSGDEVVGAIGVSGTKSEVDEEIALLMADMIA